MLTVRALMFSLACAASALIGCAAQPVNNLTANEIPTAESSIVFGSIADYGLFGTAIEFKNIATQAKFPLSQVRGLFVLKLVPGTYVLSERGTIAGASTACDEKTYATFTVPEKALVYAGSFFTDVKSDKYYYDLKSVPHSKTKGPYAYCLQNGWGQIRENKSYHLWIYDNLAMDQQELFKIAPQLKSALPVNQALAH